MWDIELGASVLLSRDNRDPIKSSSDEWKQQISFRPAIARMSLQSSSFLINGKGYKRGRGIPRIAHESNPQASREHACADENDPCYSDDVAFIKRRVSIRSRAISIFRANSFPYYLATSPK